MAKIIVNVDLDCNKCYNKIRKVLYKLHDQETFKSISFDGRSKTIVIAGPFDPEKVAYKIRCKAGRVVKDVQIMEVGQPKMSEPPVAPAPPQQSQPKPAPTPPVDYYMLPAVPVALTLPTYPKPAQQSLPAPTPVEYYMLPAVPVAATRQPYPKPPRYYPAPPPETKAPTQPAAGVMKPRPPALPPAAVTKLPECVNPTESWKVSTVGRSALRYQTCWCGCGRMYDCAPARPPPVSSWYGYRDCKIIDDEGSNASCSIM